MLRIMAVATLGALIGSAASAQSYNLESCFEEAGIKYVAQEAGIDMTTARQVAPMLPQGKAMLASMRESAAAADRARASGVDKDTLMIVARGSMAETPALGGFVASCINRYY